MHVIIPRRFAVFSIAGMDLSPGLDKPLLCGGCFDLYLHLTGSRWLKESVSPHSSPLQMSPGFFSAGSRSPKQQYNIGHSTTL